MSRKDYLDVTVSILGVACLVGLVILLVAPWVNR